MFDKCIMKEFRSIVLSGGAFKAASIIGVIKYLEERHLIKNLQRFIGTSAGAVICFLLAMGYTSSEIKAFLIKVINNDTINQFHIEDICNIFDTFGIDTGEKLELIFQKALYEKTYRNDISFIEFGKMFGKDLIVCVSNLTKEQSEFWSIDTCPYRSVILALKVSCSIPVIFPPIKVDDMMYVDGGVFNNFPISFFDNKQFKDLIGVNIKTNSYKKHDTFLNYICFLIYAIIEKSNIKPLTDLKNNIVTINFTEEDEIDFSSLDDLKLKVPESIIEKYITAGYDAIALLANSTSAEVL